MPVDHTQLFSLGSEREALAMNLDAQREGLVRKIEGLDDELARQAPTASPLSLLGLVKHSVTWERRWFQVIMAGREDPDGWPEVLPEPVDVDMVLDDRCARADIIECNVRYVMFHMIQETARHAGHADIIRETLDGVTGI